MLPPAQPNERRTTTKGGHCARDCGKATIILADEPTGNLDTKSGAAVMDILHGLHEEGRTVLLITHDERIAQRAQRRVAIRDGVLEEAVRPRLLV